MQKINEIRSIISRWLKSRLEGENYQWLITKGDLLKDNPEDWELYTSFSAVPKYTGKKKISLSEDERKKADMIRNGWDPSAWSLDELGRTFLMLCYTEQGKDEFLDKIEKTFVTSDMNEAVALYKALPLYPFPEQFRLRAAEGVRSNITTVFNAVALDNPYPKENLDEGAWNQIVLKALFVGSPLYRIQGVDERANETLAKILVEYAHERWSAGRTVSPELWRPVGPFLHKGYENEIKRVLEHSEKIQKQAAVLALESSHYSGKGKLVSAYDAVIKDVKQQRITWDDIGKALEASKKQLIR